MLALVLVIAVVLTNPAHTYYKCDCYCPSRTSYVGTALAFTCSSSACSIACLGSLTNPSSCSSPLTTYGTCRKGYKRSNIPGYLP